MKRGLLVMAGLLLWAATSSADYVVIRINLGASDPSGGPGLFPAGGFGPGPGGDTGTGDGPGARGGRGAAGGGAAGAGFQGGGAGMRGGMMPGGGAGARGGMVPGGGAGARGGMMPGGGGGMRGGMMPPGAGFQGGPGMMGPMGAGPGFPGAQPGTPGGEEAQAAKPLWFIAVVDAERAIKDKEGNYVLTHKWGRSVLPQTIGNVIVKIDVLDRVKAPNMDVRRDRKRDKLLEEEPKGAKELSPAGMLKLAEWLLQHWNLPTEEGRLDIRAEFDKLLAKVETLDAANAKVKLLVSAREHIRKPLPAPDAELGLAKEFLSTDSGRLSKSDHYVMLHHASEDKTAAHKLHRLEHVYAGFYYWFALQGKALPVPQQKLITVLALGPDRKNFNDLHELFDSLPLVADGFYSGFDNVAIFAPTRLDDLFQRFHAEIANQEKQGMELAKILAGRDLFKDKDQDLVAYWRAIALAFKAAEDEGEVATLTQEAIQQLAVAARLLPGRVQAPFAVRFGLGTFFETPKSDGPLNTISYWSGIGAPSWLYLPVFKKIADAEGKELTLLDSKLKIEPLSILKIITDQNFDAVAKAAAKDRLPLTYKARAEAWALSYYLAREKLDQLLKFYQELARLPRDMELTPEVVTVAFARGFDLVDPADPFKIDVNKLKKLENDWRNFMRFQDLELGPTPEPKIDLNPTNEPGGGKPNQPGKPGSGLAPT